VLWTIFFVAVGGFFGAVTRFLINQLTARLFSTAFPYGTLSVNIIGSFLLGWLIGSKMGIRIDTSYLLWSVGFLGAFTTFSTLNLEIINMAKQKKWVHLWIYMGTTYIIGLLSAFVGFIMNT
jgi:CrcB protein